ncbi:S-adenosyl-L-methionine-dependent methyltransferase [Agrocybe pediades]|nr:S-adenosyl-L-methionine-dependent methyltransferase [Agrocybe pediades]
MSARSQVTALLAIITEAAYSALGAYEESGTPTPTLNDVDGHALDNAFDTIRLKKIISKLEGACEQLCTTLSPPSHTIMNRAQDFGWACLRVAVKQRFADELLGLPSGLHINELSERVHVHPMKLGSVLRVLAARHCFREVSPNVFANNRLSISLVSDKSLSAMVDLLTHAGGQPHAALLADYLVDPEYGHSLSMDKALYQYANKEKWTHGMTFYEFLQLKENQGYRQVMMKAMISMNQTIGSLSALPAYPWSEVRSVCDVGSGMGGFSRALLDAFTHIHVAQFDLPPTIAIAKQQWPDGYRNRTTFIEGDFLMEIPALNYDVYYLRNILHNWTDEKVVTILKVVRAAMGPQSRVLVHDHVLRHMSPPSETDSDGLDLAPEPMLPNYGAGAIRLYHQDLTMMMVYNSKERSTNETIKLGKDAQLRVVKVYDLAEMCLIEFAKEDEGEDKTV